ncbi:MAG: porin [Candidatus Midichloria sp.]|nr:MAG: porin [Candidatus Midichloria sp.]
MSLYPNSLIFCSILFFILPTKATANNQFNISLYPTIGSFDGSEFISNLVDIKFKHQIKQDQSDYGIQVNLNSNFLASDSNNFSRIQARAFGFFESEYGTIQIGNNFGAHYLFQADDFKNPNFSQSINFLELSIKDIISNEAYSPDLYIYSPGLWSDQLHLQNQCSEGSRIASKISYISSLKYNLIFAASFIPDTGESIKIHNTYNFGKNNAFKDVVQLTLGYRNQVNDLDFRLAFGIESGKAKNAQSTNLLFLPDESSLINAKQQENLKSWDLSAQAAYTGFNLGFSYGNNYKSGQYYIDNCQNGVYWNLGISYSIFRFSVSLSHFNSQNINGDLQKSSLTAVYHIKKGIHLFTELSQIELFNKTTTPFKSSRFNCFLIGSKISF